MAYNAKLTKKKGISGGVEGIVTAALSILAVSAVKTNMEDVSPELENQIAGTVGLLVGGIVLGMKRLFANWRKHRNR